MGMLFKQLCQSLHTIDYDDASNSALFNSKNDALDFVQVCKCYNVEVDVLDGFVFINKTQYVPVFIVTPVYNPAIAISLEKKNI